MTGKRARSFVLITGDFVPTGGMDAPNMELARYLARQGDDVHLVAYRADAGLLSEPNVRLHKAPKPMRSYALGGPMLAARAFGVAHTPALRHAITLSNGGSYTFARANWVHYVHAAFEPEVSGPKWMVGLRRAQREIFLRTERAALGRAECVIVNSDLTGRHVTELCGVDPSRVHTVYYGSDPRFRPPTEEARQAAIRELGLDASRPHLAFVGALGDRRKGFDVLFDAWKKLARTSSWDAKLLVIGKGHELEAWKSRARSEGLDSSIRFLGFRKDVPKILSASDGLVAPTRYEAYGLGVHEALLTGLPAIVSRASGVAERYPSALHRLLLDDPNDATALAECLEAWRSEHGGRGDPSGWRARLLDLAGELASHTWEDMSRSIRGYLERLRG